MNHEIALIIGAVGVGVIGCAVALCAALLCFSWRRRRKAPSPEALATVARWAGATVPLVSSAPLYLRMSAPPIACWERREGKVYTAFLSHYKAECASTARYLHDLLQKMLGTEAYLDSSSLSDLRTLFDVGLRASDTLVLLASRSVLTRPWCLLELWEASLAAIPVVVLDVHAGFDRADARHLLMNLESELEARNPGALAEVESHVLSKGATLDELSQALLTLLDLREPPAACPSGALDAWPPHGSQHSSLASLSLSSLSPQQQSPPKVNGTLQWDPCSSDRLLLGATKDLAERLALVTGRSLKWHDPLAQSSTSETSTETGRTASAQRTVRGEGGRAARTPKQVTAEDARNVGTRGGGSSSSSGHAMAAARSQDPNASAKAPKAGAKTANSFAVGKSILRGWAGWWCARAPPTVSDRSSVADAADGCAYGLFISYCRQEAAAHARLLHALLEKESGRPAFLDATDAFDLDQILREGVARSRAVVLVQTRSTLQRPWCLIELYAALMLRKPIVCIAVKGGGYDFGENKAFLSALATELQRTAPCAFAELQEWLSRHGESVRQLQSRLHRAIPNMISVPFDPLGSTNHTTAVVQEVLDRAQKVDHLMQRRKTLFRISQRESTSARTSNAALSHWMGGLHQNTLPQSANLERSSRVEVLPPMWDDASPV